MNSSQSSSEQFMQYLKSIGGSEADISETTHTVTDEDTVESVVYHLRFQQQQEGSVAREQSILHAAAQVVISRRDELDPVRHAGASQAGEYELDMHLSAEHTTRESIPEKELREAQIWARARIESQGAEFGAIYFPAGGAGVPGSGALVSSFDRSVGWYR